jgi:hypothetical protein
VQLRPDGEKDLAVEVTGEVLGAACLPQHGLVHGLQPRRLVQVEGAIGGAPEQPQRQLDDAVGRAAQVGQAGRDEPGPPGPSLVRHGVRDCSRRGFLAE